MATFLGRPVVHEPVEEFEPLEPGQPDPLGIHRDQRDRRVGVDFQGNVPVLGPPMHGIGCLVEQL